MEPSVAAKPSTTSTKIAGAIARYAVVAVIFCLIIRTLVINWPDLRHDAISCDVTYLLVSLVLFCLHALLYAMLWHRLTVANNAAIAHDDAIRAWFYSLLGKYVPGKVLLWAGRVYPYKRAGHSIKRVTFCFTLEMAFQILAASVIVTVALAQSPDSPLAELRHAAWALLVVLVVLTNPRVLQFLFNVALKALGREPVTIDMSVRDTFALLLGYLANGVVLGASFFFFAKAFSPLDASQYLFVAGAFLISGMIGVLSVFAPAGLGVREGLLALVLCLIMPKATAIVVALAARLWSTTGELLCVAIAFTHDKLQQRSARRLDQIETSRTSACRLAASDDLAEPHHAGSSCPTQITYSRKPSPANPRSTLIILSLLGFLLVMVSTSRYGVGLSPDSVNYIGTARNLLAGNGYLTFDDTPYTHWAPLLPTMLAGLGLIGIEPQTGARLINAAAFALVIFCCGRLFARHVKSRALATMGAVSILLANPLFGHCALALTEPTFVLLSMLLFTALIKFIQAPALRPLLFAAALAALCFLDRYIGIAMILCGAVAIALVAKRVSLPRRFGYGCLFGLVAVVPGSLWMLHNYMVVNAISAGWPESTVTFSGNLTFMLDTLSSWFLPENIPLWIRLPVIGVVLAALAALSIALPSPRSATPASDRRTSVAVAAIFAAVYTAILVAISMTIKIEELDNRMMLPVYVFLFFILIVLADRALDHLRAWRPNARWATTVLLAFCVLWLMYPLARVSRGVWRRVNLGAGGYNTVVWRDSPVMLDLRSSPPPGTIYSNRPDAIYILNNMDAYWGPSKRIGAEPFLQSMDDGPNNYMVWFDRGRNSTYHPDELTDSFASELVARFSDGAIYRFERRQQRATRQ